MPVTDIYIDFQRATRKEPYYSLAMNFNLFSRTLCSFISQYLAKNNIEKFGFNKIIIRDEITPQAVMFNNTYYINTSKCLCIFFSFPMDEYEKLITKLNLFYHNTDYIQCNAIDDIAIHHYFITILRQSNKIIEINFGILAQHIENGIEAFIANNYKHKWIHRRKTQGRNFEVLIKCEMVLGGFKAFIEIIKDKNVILFELIALDYDSYTYKDDFMLGYELKAIKINNNTVEIWDKTKVTHAYIIPDLA